MRVIQLKDDQTYGRVLYQLHYKIGGIFHSRPERTVIVSQDQWEALRDAGLLAENSKRTRAYRGKEKR